MTAKIIDLHQYRSTVRSKANGIAFPQVYRILGFCADVEGDQIRVSEERGPTLYSLSQDDDCGLLNATRTVIRGFDPEMDDGWLIVRHHMSETLVEGYLDSIMDHSHGEPNTAHTVYRTDKGLFTLSHRQPTPGCPNHLVIYITKVPDDSGLGIGWVDHWTFVLPDGSTSEDEDAFLYPPEEE